MTTTYSFGTIGTAINFEVAGPTGWRRSRAANLTITHIPYSNTNYLDSGGALERRYQGNIILANNTDYDALEDLLGTSGTLVCPDGSLITASLASLDRPELYNGGNATSTAVIATASFVEATP